MPKRANDPEKLISTKIRTSTRPKLDILKKLHGTKSDYDMLKIAVDLAFITDHARITALAELLQIELPA
ncbi:hypothetical protein SAMN06265337_1228 [Hymenobacter gelipurpurascens]|uniref:Uncharacterized protein n=1 Tax=Hymenobacter gelipurpurascens TaxID=89968 RepID=A0A212TGR7_9BACT|nr:hypothetical protein [Hymenobacter gelipurpurascens]SNC65165.1 hypothetical protein SAMN06265337_1228 [Hymenobacter gelipurpurascens]